MMSRTELTGPLAAAAAAFTVLLGGGFYPLPRIAVAIVLMVVASVSAVTARGRIDRTAALGVAFIGWGVISATWVGASPLASKEAVTTWLVALVLWAAARRSSEVGRRSAVVLLSAAAVMVAVAIVIDGVKNGFRVGGLLENPNVAVALLVPTIPLGVQQLASRPKWRAAWILLVGTGVLVTGSRAGLLAAVVVVWMLLPRGRVRFLGSVGVFVLAAAAVSWRFFSQPDVLAWHRVSIWGAVLRIWWQRPWTGVGPGSLLEAAGPERICEAHEIGRFQFIVGYAESTPLSILVQLGVVGIVLFGICALSWWLDSRRSGVLASSHVRACIAAMICLALFHDFLTIDPVLWWWAVLLGCISGRFPTEVKSQRRSLITVLRWATALAVAWLIAWGIVTPAIARLVWQHGEPTEDLVVRALRIEPWFAEAPAQRARALLAVRAEWDWKIAAEAIRRAHDAVDLRPGLARHWADLGRVYLRVLSDLGGTEYDRHAAKESLLTACRLDPHLPWNWLELARFERITGDSQAALRYAERAVTEEPNVVRGWLMLARLELELGRPDAAREALAKAERSLSLSTRMHLSGYERELLFAPPEELRVLKIALETDLGTS